MESRCLKDRAFVAPFQFEELFLHHLDLLGQGEKRFVNLVLRDLLIERADHGMHARYRAGNRIALFTKLLNSSGALHDGNEGRLL
jgi:hypothetical protein